MSIESSKRNWYSRVSRWITIPTGLFPVLSLLFFSTTSCREPNSAGEHPSVLRLIAEEPIQRLHSPSTSASYMQFRWNPASADESEEWLIRPNDAESFADSGRLVLSSLTVPPRIIKKVKLDASSVNVIEVDVIQSEKGRTPSRLFWAKRGEHFRRENSLTEAVKVVNPDEVYTYRFHVGRHQSWSGRIKMLRFDPQPKPDFKPGRRSMILEMRGFRASLTKEDLARIASKSWKVDLGNDLRDGLVTPPGLPVEQEVFVPPDARLELSYGVWGPSRGVITFRAGATDIRSEKKEIILERTVDLTSKNRSDQWNQAEMDLSQFSGHTVSLEFEAEYDAPAESAQILAV